MTDAAQAQARVVAYIDSLYGAYFRYATAYNNRVVRNGLLPPPAVPPGLAGWRAAEIRRTIDELAKA